MIDPEIIELMNMDLDGALSPSESAELRRRIASDPEAEKYFESLRATVTTVDACEEREPPAHIEERILAAVPFGRYPAGSTRKGLAARLEQWFFSPRLRYAAVFAGGLAFGIIVYAAISYDNGRSDDMLDNSDYWGTMRHINDADGFKQTDVLGVDLDGVRGQVSLHESEAILLADVALESSGEIEWVLEYDAKGVSFDGYRCFDGARGNVVAGKAEMRVLQTGGAHYLLFFTQKDHPVRPIVVKIYSADRLLLERSLDPAG
jgi:hypothetical protein